MSKFRGMFTGRVMSVDRDKSLVTGEKRYAPKIEGKRLRLSWNTRTKAEVYGNAVLVRYEKKLAVHSAQKEKQDG